MQTQNGQSLVIVALVLVLIVLFLFFWAQGGNVTLGTIEYQTFNTIERAGNAILGR